MILSRVLSWCIWSFFFALATQAIYTERGISNRQGFVPTYRGRQYGLMWDNPKSIHVYI